jgi:hypothetical protein
MRAIGIVVLLTGCVVYDETVHVHLRDPHAVTVSVATPSGERELAGSAAEIPPTAPPYLEDGRVGASVIRDSDGITALCPWCEWSGERPVVTSDGEVDLVGTPSHIRRIGDVTRMTFQYVAPLHCHHHGGLCDRPAFELEVDTPHDNVARIEFERRVARDHGELIGAKLGVGWGLLFVTMGLAGIGYFDVAGEAKGSSAKWAVLGVGGAFITIGGSFTWIGVKTLRAQDSLTSVTPP